MEVVFAAVTGLLVACGVYLLLRGRTFSVVTGLMLLSYAINLFLFASGGLVLDPPPLSVRDGVTPATADPLPQALVLTAIVIGFAMTAFVLVLAVVGRKELGSDRVDGEPERSAPDLPAGAEAP